MQDRRRNWTDFEDRAIITLVKKHGTKNWAEISEKMNSKYGIEQRTGKQCRERWHNHLDPDVNKQEWTDKQQQAMFQAHQQQGNHWTQIAKQFPGRTDNDVKNHFYSMLRRSLRRVNKLLGLRNSTKKVRLIKPSVLSKFFAQTSQQANPKEWKKISEALFQFSKSKTIDLGDLQGDDRKRLQDLIQAIAQYNQEYELNQLTKKNSKKSSKKESQQQQKIEKQKIKLDKQAIKQQNHQSQSQNDDDQSVSNRSSQDKIIKKRKEKPISKKAKPQKTKPLSQKIARKSRNTKKPQEIVEQIKNTVKQPYNLRKRQSQISFKLDEQFNFNQLIELPQLSQNDRRRSSCIDSRRASSSNSSNFYLSSSPKMDMRIFARTPTGPTPNIGDMLTRGSNFFQWTANEQVLEDNFAQIKRQIERKTNCR